MLRVFKVLQFNECENVHRMFSEHYFENVRMQHSDTTICEHSQNSQKIVFLHNVRVIFGRHEQITKHCTHCGEYSRIFAPSWDNRGGHRFPSDLNVRKKWLMAIKRVNPDHSLWKPSESSIVCKEHFRDTDYEEYNGRGEHKIITLTSLIIGCQ